MCKSYQADLLHSTMMLKSGTPCGVQTPSQVPLPGLHIRQICRPLSRPFSPIASPCLIGIGSQESCSRRIALTAAKGGFGAKPDPSKLTGQTCPCGSKQLYKDCCEQYHTGKANPATPDIQLRARFCAFVKGEQDYIIKTFHPSYLTFKYPGQAPGGDNDPAEQLKRDVRMACASYQYSGFKIIKTEPGATEDEAFVEFRYRSVQKSTEKRTNSRHTRVKAGPVDRNLDGTAKVCDTLERSRFIRDDQGWRFADFELISYPDWMQEAKEAELKSRRQLQQQKQPQEQAAAA